VTGRRHPLRLGAAAAQGTGMVVAVASVLACPDAGAGQNDARSDVIPVTAHVVLVSVDGLRADAIERFGLRTLQRLIAEGNATLEATTVRPSRTLPSHASMLTGVSPEVHGVTWNTHVPSRGPVPVPTVFELARAQGLHTAAFYAKAKLRQLDRAGAYDYRAAPAWNREYWMSTEVLPEAIQYLRHRRPHLLFIHVPEPDYAGHVWGWMGRVYGMAARRADAAIGEILAAAESAYGPDGFTLLVTSDHGGDGHDHGADDPRHTLIPWLVYGRGVVPGRAPAGIRTMDTAATVLWLLGVPIPDHMEGVPVAKSFAAGSRSDYQRARAPLTSMWMNGPLTRFAR
jgi:arylsulfatase A-like enzyme